MEKVNAVFSTLVFTTLNMKMNMNDGFFTPLHFLFSWLNDDDVVLKKIKSDEDILYKIVILLGCNCIHRFRCYPLTPSPVLCVPADCFFHIYNCNQH